MTPMEMYLCWMCLVSLLISAGSAMRINRIRSMVIDSLEEFGKGGTAQMKAITAHSEALRSLYDITIRQEQRLADQETKVMGLMNQGKDLANLRTEHRQAAEILLEKIREHERKLDALAVAMLKSGN